jgi:Tfp pilus assembly protein PilF
MNNPGGMTAMKKETNKFIFAALILVVLVLVSYWKVFDNEFVDWDDFTYVVNNDLVRNPGDTYFKDLFTTPVSSNYHPLTILSMKFNSNACDSCPNGISPAPFIRGNVILHILNSLLVLLLVFLLTKRNFLTAFIAALLFAIHPAHVESVAWIAERKDVLYSFFFLSGLIAWLLFKKGGRGKSVWFALSYLLFIFSCLSKAVAVIFPLIIMLINFWIYHTEDDKPILRSLKEAFSPGNLLLLLPFFIVSVFVGLMAFNIQDGNNFLGLLDISKNAPDVVNEIGPFNFLQRIQIASFGIITYIIKFILPVNLSPLYPYPTLQEFNDGTFHLALWFTLAAVIALIVMTIISLRKTKLYAFGGGFFLVTAVLVLQFITVGMAIAADRYTYLPYIGLSIIPASLIAGASGKTRNILMAAGLCFIIFFMAQTRKQVDVWQNTETLWSKAIERDPGLEVGLRSRGKYYSKKAMSAKSPAEKAAYENKAYADFREAIKAGTRSADVYEGAAVIYGSRREPEKAILFLNKALEINPKKGSAYYNRALIYDQSNKKEEAISDYNMALIYSPEKVFEIINNRSNLLLETGRFKEAAQDLDFLISEESNNFIYYYNRGIAKAFLNDLDGAIADVRKSLELKPDDKQSEEALKKLLSLK